MRRSLQLYLLGVILNNESDKFLEVFPEYNKNWIEVKILLAEVTSLLDYTYKNINNPEYKLNFTDEGFVKEASVYTYSEYLFQRRLGEVENAYEFLLRMYSDVKLSDVLNKMEGYLGINKT